MSDNYTPTEEDLKEMELHEEMNTYELASLLARINLPYVTRSYLIKRGANVTTIADMEQKEILRATIEREGHVIYTVNHIDIYDYLRAVDKSRLIPNQSTLEVYT